MSIFLLQLLILMLYNARDVRIYYGMMKKVDIKVIFCSVALIMSVSLNITALILIVPVSAADKSGLVVTVVDGLSGKPVMDATVCIPETGSYNKTDAMGKTAAIQVPLIRNQNFDTVHKRGWGEITLLVYKDGYIDFILFYTIIPADRVRYGPVVMLFEAYAADDGAIQHLVEGPPEEWIRELVEKYRK